MDGSMPVGDHSTTGNLWLAVEQEFSTGHLLHSFLEMKMNTLSVERRKKTVIVNTQS